MDNITLAYIAGLVDGEAYIGIKKTSRGHYHARIQVRMVEEAGIALMRATFGGRYYKEKPHASQGRPLYCYQASDAIAEFILRRLQPFLRVKRNSADTVLEFRSLVRTRDRRRVARASHLARCEVFYLACKRLNRVGIAALADADGHGLCL